MKNERLSYEALRHQTSRLCEYRGEHVIHQSFVANCFYAGVNVKVLSKLLGHADVNVTYNIYVHLYANNIFIIDGSNWNVKKQY